MRILHTESSCGWGGQEIRILREAQGMRERGHEVVFAVAKGGGLVIRARSEGFMVYEVTFKKGAALKTIPQLVKIISNHQIDLINTHSSTDSWLGGIAARIAKKKIVRTRHLSTPTRTGLNSHLLYKCLSDFVVTTSSGILPAISEHQKCRCIPTGIDPQQIRVSPENTIQFREQFHLAEGDLLIGTACFVRSWKGIHDLMKAADLLRHRKDLKWVVIGGGYVDDYKKASEEMGLKGIVHFTGHLENPFDAIHALDIFTLLSTANEGVSQASLQAAFLERPLLTTTIGGLPEVCLPDKTGLLVPPFAPQKIAGAVLELAANPARRAEMGRQAKQLILEKFLWRQTLDAMESVYAEITPPTT
jgi:glycosyltransferase involved in cell wall biosynthesis